MSSPLQPLAPPQNKRAESSDLANALAQQPIDHSSSRLAPQRKGDEGRPPLAPSTRPPPSSQSNNNGLRPQRREGRDNRDSRDLRDNRDNRDNRSSGGSGDRKDDRWHVVGEGREYRDRDRRDHRNDDRRHERERSDRDRDNRFDRDRERSDRDRDRDRPRSDRRDDRNDRRGGGWDDRRDGRGAGSRDYGRDGGDDRPTRDRAGEGRNHERDGRPDRDRGDRADRDRGHRSSNRSTDYRSAPRRQESHGDDHEEENYLHEDIVHEPIADHPEDDHYDNEAGRYSREQLLQLGLSKIWPKPADLQDIPDTEPVVSDNYLPPVTSIPQSEAERDRERSTQWWLSIRAFVPSKFRRHPPSSSSTSWHESSHRGDHHSDRDRDRPRRDDRSEGRWTDNNTNKREGNREWRSERRGSEEGDHKEKRFAIEDFMTAAEGVDDAKWFYQDPSGQNQGPFSRDEMKQWYELRYFDLKLPIKSDANPSAPFIPLGVWFLHGKKAFLDHVPIVDAKLPTTAEAKEEVIQQPSAPQPIQQTQTQTIKEEPKPLPQPAPQPIHTQTVTPQQAVAPQPSQVHHQPHHIIQPPHHIHNHIPHNDYSDVADEEAFEQQHPPFGGDISHSAPWSIGTRPLPMPSHSIHPVSAPQHPMHPHNAWADRAPANFPLHQPNQAPTNQMAMNHANAWGQPNRIIGQPPVPQKMPVGGPQHPMFPQQFPPQYPPNNNPPMQRIPQGHHEQMWEQQQWQMRPQESFHPHQQAMHPPGPHLHPPSPQRIIHPAAPSHHEEHSEGFHPFGSVHPQATPFGLMPQSIAGPSFEEIPDVDEHDHLEAEHPVPTPMIPSHHNQHPLTHHPIEHHETQRAPTAPWARPIQQPPAAQQPSLIMQQQMNIAAQQQAERAFAEQQQKAAAATAAAKAQQEQKDNQIQQQTQQAAKVSAPPAIAPWARKPSAPSAVPTKSLAEIQEEEMRKEQEAAAERARQAAAAAEEKAKNAVPFSAAALVAGKVTNAQSITVAAPAPIPVVIKAEEEKSLPAQQKKETITPAPQPKPKPTVAAAVPVAVKPAPTAAQIAAEKAEREQREHQQRMEAEAKRKRDEAEAARRKEIEEAKKKQEIIEKRKQVWGVTSVQPATDMRAVLAAEEARKRQVEAEAAAAAASRPEIVAAQPLMGAWGLPANRPIATGPSLRDIIANEQSTPPPPTTAASIVSSAAPPAITWGSVAGKPKSLNEIQAEEKANAVLRKPPVNTASIVAANAPKHETDDENVWEFKGSSNKAPAAKPAPLQPAATPAKPSNTASKPSTAAAPSSASTDGDNVFGGPQMSPEFEGWCRRELQKLTGSSDITLAQFLMTLESSGDILEYIHEVLGSSCSSADIDAFGQAFCRQKQFDSERNEEANKDAKGRKGRRKK